MTGSMSDFAQFFRVLANETRFKILKTLYESKSRMSVNELAKKGRIPLSKISDQLMVLRKHNLVSFEKEGTCVNYIIRESRIFENIKSYYGNLNLNEPKKNTIATIIEDPFSKASYQIYKILANETRCELLVKIAEKERYVNELCEMFYLEQPTISMHLNFIKRTNLIKSRKQHTKKYYYIA